MQWISPRQWPQQLLSRCTQVPPIHTIGLFKAVIYLWLLGNTLLVLPIAHQIWGTGSLIIPFEFEPSFLNKLYFILANPRFANFYPWVMGVQVAAIFCWYATRRKVFSVLIYAATALLFAPVDAYTTGGHYLVVLFAFFFIFMSTEEGGPIQNALSNLFLFACKMQLALVYLFAGLYKIHGTHWLTGDAVYFVLNIREFSHPLVREWLLPHPALLKLASWVGLGYQLLFPIFIWVKPLKWPLLTVGVGFHLFIAFAVGLPDFGLLMVMSYTMFVSDKWLASSWLRAKNSFSPSSAR